MSNFIDDCLCGNVLLDDIDDFIDAWHDGDDDISLSEFLGMTQKEYALWVKEPTALPFIINAHRKKTTIDEIIVNQHKIAARGDVDVDEISTWLKGIGFNLTDE